MKIECPSCSGKIDISDTYAGNSIPCPHCGSIIAVSATQTDFRNNCPRCKSAMGIGATKCMKCGYDKTGRDEEKIPLLSKEALICLPLGFILGFAIMYMPWVKFILSQIAVLFHEFGHSLAGWAFGYPTIPAFDFTHGGGVAIHIDRQYVQITWAVYAFLVWIIYKNIDNKKIVAFFAALLAGYAYSVNTEFKQMVILYLGHGMELLLAGVFIYRGMSGRAVHHFVERILYYGFGFFVICLNVVFSWKLMKHEHFKEEYLQGKGGTKNDFHRMAEDMHGHFHHAFEHVAQFHIFMSLATVFIALFFHWQLNKGRGDMGRTTSDWD